MERYASYDLMVNVLPEEGGVEMAFEGCKTAATCGDCTNTTTSAKPRPKPKPKFEVFDVAATDADFTALDEQLDSVLAAR